MDTKNPQPECCKEKRVFIMHISFFYQTHLTEGFVCSLMFNWFKTKHSLKFLRDFHEQMQNNFELEKIGLITINPSDLKTYNDLFSE